MSKYWLVFKIAVLDVFQYRFDFFMTNLKYALSILLMTFVWIAVSESSDQIHQTIPQLAAYFLAGTFIYSLSNFHTNEIEEDIRLGGLNKYLVKPISPFWFYLTHQSGQVVLEMIFKAILFSPLLWWLRAEFVTGWQVVIFFLFIPSIYLFAFFLLTSVSQMCFWIQEAYSLRWAVTVTSRFLAGFFAPLYFFPEWFQKLSPFLPFQYLAYFPIQLLLGKVSVVQGLMGLSILWFWILVWGGLNRWQWHQGIQKFEGTGI